MERVFEKTGDSGRREREKICRTESGWNGIKRAGEGRLEEDNSMLISVSGMGVGGARGEGGEDGRMQQVQNG